MSGHPFIYLLHGKRTMNKNRLRYFEIKEEAKLLGIKVEQSNTGFSIIRGQKQPEIIGNADTIEEAYQFICAYKLGYDDGVSGKEVELTEPIFSNQITY